MDIKITYKSNNYIVENVVILWKYQLKKSLRFFMIFLLVGIFLIVAGAIEKTENTSYWNFNTFFGTCLVVIVIFLFGLMLDVRAKDLGNARVMTERFNKHNNISELRITNFSISSKTIESLIELKWSYFDFFSIYKNHILIISGKGSIFSMAIKKDDITESEFRELYGILISNLTNKSKKRLSTKS